MPVSFKCPAAATSRRGGQTKSPGNRRGFSCFRGINIAEELAQRGHLDPAAAVDKLDEVIRTHTELIRLQAEANELTSSLVLAELASATNRKRELDLIAQKQAMDREAENRRESRLNEVLQRLIRQETRAEAIVGKLATQDDAFRDTVERLIEKTKAIEAAQRDIEQAIHSLLTREITEMQTARRDIKARLEKRDLLAAHYDTLNKLQIQAARRGDDVPVHLQNAIEQKKREISELESQP